MATQKQTEVIDEKWDYYKQRGNVQLWTAVGLTMDLDPRRGARTMIATISPELSAEYKKRKMIAISRYGIPNGLKSLDHHAARATAAGRYVALQDMLEFAKAMDWHRGGNLTPMLEAIGPQVEEPQVLQTDLYQEPKRQYGKGSRYRELRVGALLDLINQWIKKDRKIPELFINGQTLSIDPLAEELAGQIEKNAHANGLTGKVSAQGYEGIRNQLGDDQKAFADVGKSKKNNRSK